MTSLLTARRRAEEFAALTDGGGPATGAHGAGLTELLEVVDALRGHEQVDPRPEFAAQLRADLLTEAETLSDTSVSLLLPPRRPARQRKLVAAASVAVLVGGTATMAAASQSALPGEALYPVKRGIERAQVWFNSDSTAAGQDLLAQADSRLAEVDALLAEDSTQSRVQVPATLAVFASQANDGSQVLLESYEETGDDEAVRSIRTFTIGAISTLEDLAGEVPTNAEDELATAALALRDIDRQAESTCGSCLSDLPTLDTPELLLARAEVDRALRVLPFERLDNSHPVVVPKGSVEQSKPGRPEGQGEPTEPKSPNPAPVDGTGKEEARGESPAEQAPSTPSVPAPSPSSPANPLPSPPNLPGGGNGANGDSEDNEASGPRLPEDNPARGLQDGPLQTLFPDSP